MLELLPADVGRMWLLGFGSYLSARAWGILSPTPDEDLRPIIRTYRNSVWRYAVDGAAVAFMGYILDYLIFDSLIPALTAGGMAAFWVVAQILLGTGVGLPFGKWVRERDFTLVHE